MRLESLVECHWNLHRWKPIRVLEFEARQLERIRVELSEEYEKSTGLPAAKRRGGPMPNYPARLGLDRKSIRSLITTVSGNLKRVGERWRQPENTSVHRDAWPSRSA